LEGKNQGIIYEAADGLVELCEEAVSNHKPKSGNASNPASSSPLRRRARRSWSHSVAYRISTLKRLSLAIMS